MNAEFVSSSGFIIFIMVISIGANIIFKKSIHEHFAINPLNLIKPPDTIANYDLVNWASWDPNQRNVDSTEPSGSYKQETNNKKAQA